MKWDRGECRERDGGEDEYKKKKRRRKRHGGSDCMGDKKQRRQKNETGMEERWTGQDGDKKKKGEEPNLRVYSEHHWEFWIRVGRCDIEQMYDNVHQNQNHIQGALHMYFKS